MVHPTANNGVIMNNKSKSDSPLLKITIADPHWSEMAK